MPTALNDSDFLLLIDVLARTDALFSPPRAFTGPPTHLPGDAWSAVEERRAAFESRGVDFIAGGAVADQKRAERQLAALQSKQLLAIAVRGGRRAGVKLTDAGDDLARFHTALKLRHQAWPVLKRMAMLIKCGVCYGALVREDDLARTDYGSADITDKLIDLEDNLYPLKAAGLVNDACDAKAHVWYRLTETGQWAVKVAPPKKPRGLGEYRKLSDEFRTHAREIHGGPGRLAAVRSRSCRRSVVLRDWPRQVMERTRFRDRAAKEVKARP